MLLVTNTTKNLTMFVLWLYLKYNFKIFLYKNDTKSVTDVEKVTCQQAVGPGVDMVSRHGTGSSLGGRGGEGVDRKPVPVHQGRVSGLVQLNYRVNARSHEVSFDVDFFPLCPL